MEKKKKKAKILFVSIFAFCSYLNTRRNRQKKVRIRIKSEMKRNEETHSYLIRVWWRSPLWCWRTLFWYSDSRVDCAFRISFLCSSFVDFQKTRREGNSIEFILNDFVMFFLWKPKVVIGRWPLGPCWGQSLACRWPMAFCTASSRSAVCGLASFSRWHPREKRSKIKARY